MGCPGQRVFIPESALFWALPGPEGTVAELFTARFPGPLKSGRLFSSSAIKRV